jgi:hypothetical protein
LDLTLVRYRGFKSRVEEAGAMGPSGPDPNTVMEFYQEALLWSMWAFLGMAVMASAAYGIFLFQQ